MLKIYDSMTQKKLTFVPMTKGKVKMYVCGMTVYDYCHLGHARVLVVFDTVVRYLRELGYDVDYVRNITDIDDKIIKRANENGEPVSDLTERFITAMHEDAQVLGITPPDQEPQATGSMDKIIAMINTLVRKSYAYSASNGDVYFDVSRFEGYGALSNKKLDDLRVGSRVDVDENKDDPLDFVLWKAGKPDEPSWDSPWGAGRPGWHIECSAMSTDCLGHTFDIHGGGMDLQFPHHENEIAQSEAATGKKFAGLWMHNGFVQVNEEKMSKSLGNFFTVREILKKYQPEVVRYFILASHYRSPLNYSIENLESAKSALDRFYTALRGVVNLKPPYLSGNEAVRSKFYGAMDDDFNTPEAIAALFELTRELNREKQLGNDAAVVKYATQLKQLAGVIGLLQDDPERYFSRVLGDISVDQALISSEEVEALIEKREAARDHKEWAEADRLRDLLAEKNIILDDGKEGTTWRRA